MLGWQGVARSSERRIKDLIPHQPASKAHHQGFDPRVLPIRFADAIVGILTVTAIIHADSAQGANSTGCSHTKELGTVAIDLASSGAVWVVTLDGNAEN